MKSPQDIGVASDSSLLSLFNCALSTVYAIN